MIDSVAGAAVSPRPPAIRTMPMMTPPQYGVSTPFVEATTKPAAMSTRPTTTTALVP